MVRCKKCEAYFEFNRISSSRDPDYVCFRCSKTKRIWNRLMRPFIKTIKRIKNKYNVKEIKTKCPECSKEDVVWIKNKKEYICKTCGFVWEAE